MATVNNRSGFTLFELTCVLLILAAVAAVVLPMATSFVSDGQVTTTQASMTNLRNALIQYQQDMKGIAVWTTTTPGTVGPAPGTTGVPLTLKDLLIRPNDPFGNPVPLFNPSTRKGWRGPYLAQATGSFAANLDASFYPNGLAPALGTYTYGSLGDPAFVDGWGNPMVLQWPATTDTVDVQAQYVRLVSAGAPTKNVGGTLYSVLDTVPGTLMPTFPDAGHPTAINQRGNDLVLFVFTQDLYP